MLNLENYKNSSASENIRKLKIEYALIQVVLGVSISKNNPPLFNTETVKVQ